MIKEQYVNVDGHLEWRKVAYWDPENRKYLTRQNVATLLIRKKGSFTTKDFVDFLRYEYGYESTTTEVRELILKDLCKERYLLKTKKGNYNIYKANPKKKLKTLIHSSNGIF